MKMEKDPSHAKEQTSSSNIYKRLHKSRIRGERIGEPVANAALRIVAEQASSLHVCSLYREAFGSRTVKVTRTVTRVSILVVHSTDVQYFAFSRIW